MFSYVIYPSFTVVKTTKPRKPYFTKVFGTSCIIAKVRNVNLLEFFVEYFSNVFW